jgi:hypothetical protein
MFKHGRRRARLRGGCSSCRGRGRGGGGILYILVSPCDKGARRRVMLIRTVPPEVAESSSETYTKPVNFFFSIFAVLEDSVVAIAVAVFPSCIQRQPLLPPSLQGSIDSPKAVLRSRTRPRRSIYTSISIFRTISQPHHQLINARQAAGSRFRDER